MAVTLKDVAQRAGVSRSAVSRTFTDGASVSRKTREIVERAANELGYAPTTFITRSFWRYSISSPVACRTVGFGRCWSI
jgi:transcriptional regulator with XRE-family HTH domain